MGGGNVIEHSTVITKTYAHDGEGNPLNSFRGSINTHDACIHELPVNELFHRHEGTITTVAADSLAGDYSVTVADSTGLIALDHIQIENGVIETSFPQIISVVGNVLNLDRPLDNAFYIGDTVEKVEFNMAVDGSVTPVSFRLIPDKDQTWHVVRFLFSMTHDSAGDLGLFGNLDPLVFPIILRGYNATTNQHRTFTSWKTNAEIKNDMFDVEFDTRSSGGGTFGTSGRGSIKLGAGAAPHLDGAAGDYLELLVQSDLTGLISFNLKAQGHIEGM